MDQEDEQPMEIVDPLDGESAIEIIDLPEVLPGDANVIGFEPIGTTSLNSTLNDSQEYDGSLQQEPEDQLYNQYVSGAISFEELMKELHSKTRLNNALKNVKRSAKKRTRSSSSKTQRKATRRGFEAVSEFPEFESDMDDDDDIRSRRRRKGKSSAPRKKSDLKLELANYLGEAEIHLNNGNFEKTEEICRNIISAAPQASAPYIVLADMYYRQDRRKESQEHMLQAAERNPRDPALWMNLVDFAEDAGDLKQAIVYARNAMRSCRGDLEIRHRLVELLKATGQEKEALRVRLTAIMCAKNYDPRKAYNHIVKIAEEFAALGDNASCIHTYELAFEKLPEICPTKDQLRVLDLFQKSDRDEEALKFFLMYWGVDLICENGAVASPFKVPTNAAVMASVRRVEFAEDMNLEVLLRFLVLTLRFGLGAVVREHIASLVATATAKDLRRKASLFFDLAKACKTAGVVEPGLAIAQRLATTPKLKPRPKVLCLLGDLQVEANAHEEALATYRHVIAAVDPRCTEARLALGNLLRRLGDEKAALEVLQPSLLLPPTPQQEGEANKKSSSLSGESESDDASNGSDDEGYNDMDASGSGQNPRDDLEFFTSSEESDSDDASSGSEGDEDGEDEGDNDMDASGSGSEDDDEDRGGEGGGSSSDEARGVAHNAGKSTRAGEKGEGGGRMILEVVTPRTMLCNDPSAMRLAFERCKLLDTPSTIDQFLEEACRLLFGDVMQVYSCERPGPAVMFQYYLSKHPSVEALAHLDEGPGASSGLRVRSEDLWGGCLCRCVEVLARRRDHLTLDRLLAWASVLPWVVEVPYRRRAITHLYISNALQVGHGETAMEAMRQIEKDFSHLNQYWNLLNLASTMSMELRLTRFLLRRIAKDRDNLGASLMSCGDCMARGSSRYTIALMTDIRSRFPDNPLISLLLAVCFLNISVHKHLFSRHKTVLQCIGFLGEYRQLRGECQETYYNIARACHQCMLGHVAIAYYEKVLEMEPVGDTEEEKRLMDLRMEAAYNLQLLYQQNHNPTMARYIMQKYLVIE